ncbi:MAG: hypothetical protein AAF988_06760 [Pseudomonadota bacterium]
MAEDTNAAATLKGPFDGLDEYSKGAWTNLGMENLCRGFLFQTETRYRQFINRLSYSQYFRLIANGVMAELSLRLQPPSPEDFPVAGGRLLPFESTQPDKISLRAHRLRLRAFRTMKKADERIALFLRQPDTIPAHLVPSFIEESSLADKLQYPDFSERFKKYGLHSIAKVLDEAIAMGQHLDLNDPSHAKALEREVPTA